MTAQDALALIEQQIDILADLHDDTAWMNSEVFEMLVDIGLAFEKPQVDRNV